MNHLAFNILPVSDGGFAVADPLIDGERLVSLLRKHETPFAKREGHPDIAGSYMGLSPVEVFMPSKRFLGECDDCDREDGMVPILGCDCGCGECWPFLVAIEVTKSEINWNSYLQPYRGKGSALASWDYSDFPRFSFDPDQYREALTLS